MACASILTPAASILVIASVRALVLPELADSTKVMKSVHACLTSGGAAAWILRTTESPFSSAAASLRVPESPSSSF